MKRLQSQLPFLSMFSSQAKFSVDIPIQLLRTLVLIADLYLWHLLLICVQDDHFNLISLIHSMLDIKYFY